MFLITRNFRKKLQLDGMFILKKKPVYIYRLERAEGVKGSVFETALDAVEVVKMFLMKGRDYEPNTSSLATSEAVQRHHKF